jgi:hypothetical protein
MPTRRPRRRQTPVDQIERLANGCCPVHGLFMPQVAAWYHLPGGDWFTIVECPRRDCQQRAKAYHVDGPWEAWDGPRPTGVLAQWVDEGRALMEILAEQWSHARALADDWTREYPRRPLPPFVRKLLDEISDRATEL